MNRKIDKDEPSTNSVTNASAANGTTSSMSPTPAEYAAISGWISLLATIILTLIAFARLREREQAVQTGKDKNPLYPNINITAGYTIVLAGVIIRAIGSQQRAVQSVQISLL